MNLPDDRVRLTQQLYQHNIIIKNVSILIFTILNVKYVHEYTVPRAVVSDTLVNTG